MILTSRRFIYLAAPVLTAGFTYALLRSVGLSRLMSIYEGLQWSTATGFALLWLGASVARAAMYDRLLDRPVGTLRLVPLMWVRGLAVDLIPARMGLATIPAALRLLWGVTISEGVGVLAGVTVVELAALGMLVLAVCAVTPPSGIPVMHSMLVSVGVGLVSILPAAVLVGRRARGLEARGRLGKALAQLGAATSALGHREVGCTVMAWSFITRLAKYGGLYALLASMPVPGLAPVPFLAAALAAEATTTLPLQGFAGVGTWEAAWVAATTAIGFSTEDAVASAFGLHLAVLGWEIVMGGIGLAILLGMRRCKP